jgi:heme-degrading monooxygenase HmoA
MHARVTSVTGSSEGVEAAISSFRDGVVPFVREQDGGEGALLLVDRATGRVLGISLWRDEEAMRASEEQANALRAQVAEQVGTASEPSVERYEVAVFER